MSVRASRTKLIKLTVPPGRNKLAVAPAGTLNVENELKALEPVIVAVVTLTVLPTVLTPVWVRPSITIPSAGPAIAGGVRLRPLAKARSAAMRRRPVPDFPRPLAVSATAIQIQSVSLQTRRYTRFMEE